VNGDLRNWGMTYHRVNWMTTPSSEEYDKGHSNSLSGDSSSPYAPSIFFLTFECPQGIPLNAVDFCFFSISSNQTPFVPSSTVLQIPTSSPPFHPALFAVPGNPAGPHSNVEADPPQCLAALNCCPGRAPDHCRNRWQKTYRGRVPRILLWLPTLLSKLHPFDEEGLYIPGNFLGKLGKKRVQGRPSLPVLLRRLLGISEWLP
jgi:hypothetical protein